MRIHEFVDEGLGHSSHLVDLDDGTATIVDPPRFPIAHEQLADRLGLSVAWTIDTHSHADYVTGSPGQCLDVGHERPVGELAGGIDAWTESGRPVATIPFVGVADMAGTIVDVRQANEYAAGHVPSARDIELGQIASVAAPVEPVTVMCGHGERAMTGASLLTARGHLEVSVLDGGPETWSAATRRPLTVGS
jgi:rhodanese-related sulfurtransferase